MKITRKQLIDEIAEETKYTLTDIKNVFRTMQKIVYQHMKDTDDVRIFEGVTLSGVKSKPHKHHSGLFGSVTMEEEHVIPKATFSEGFRFFLRGIKEDIR